MLESLERNISKRCMVLGDEKEGMLRKQEKKSKKSNKKAAINGLALTTADVKAIKGDFSFDEEKLTVVETLIQRDKEEMETKAAGEIDQCGVKRKKKRGGNHLRKSNKDSDEDAAEGVEEKKHKLKKSCKDEQQTMQYAPLDTEKSAPASASETWDYDKVVETFGVVSSGNAVDEIRRKNKSKKSIKTSATSGEVTNTEVNQGAVFPSIEEREEGSRTENGNIRKRKNVKLGQRPEDPIHENSEKRVRFSGHVQVFPSPNDPSDEKHEIEEETLLRGKRFSKLEDEIIKNAVHKYIEIHNMGEEGLQKILNSRSHPEIKGCWKEIGSAIPYRPYISVYYRAQVLFRRCETRKWTEEEYEMVRKFHREHGPKWKVLADELGKHRFHVKDTWRRLKLSNQKKGQWTQEEYQTLFDLVNTDLRLKLSEDKKSKYGMLRDNIPWSAISDKLSTRTAPSCCLKWYDQLTSPMVAKGEWADADDYHLIDALFVLDASCVEDVDWDNLLDHRPGEICRKRWNQMVLHIDQCGKRSFAEQIEVLAKRYRPDLAEVRETWDSKPIVP